MFWWKAMVTSLSCPKWRAPRSLLKPTLEGDKPKTY